VESFRNYFDAERRLWVESLESGGIPPEDLVEMEEAVKERLTELLVGNVWCLHSTYKK
jgi:hypothetical protein